VYGNLTPDPSPAANIVKNSQILIAGEGSVIERGLRPLSKSLPPLKHIKNRVLKTTWFERGNKGVSI
jgi:hypothetical protein